jgi:hypothetical protein
MKFFSLVFVFYLTLVACSASNVRGQTVIYSDTFDRVTGSGDPNFLPADPNNFSDWGMNDNLLGGTVQQTWFVGPQNRTGGANMTTDGSFGTLINGGTMFDFDVTTVAPNGFSVAFDFSRFHPINPGTGNGFIALGFGRTVPEDPNTYGALGSLNLSDFAVLFQQGAGGNVGNAQFFQDSTSAATEFLPGTGATGPLDYGDPTIEHGVLITLTPQVPGQYGDADVIDFNIVVDGSATFSSTVLGGADFGRLAISSNQSVHRYIDNLVVTALPGGGGPSADFDGDGDIDGRDFLTWQRGGSPNPLSAADLSLWQGQFPSPLAAIEAVPEPSSALLLLLGVSFAVWQRNRA